VTQARRLDLRLVLLVAFVAAAIWAATALAGGGSQPASGDSGRSNGPASGFVQDQGGGGAQPPSSGDCPDRGGSRGDGSGGGAPDV
jgi:hypothetical protein